VYLYSALFVVPHTQGAQAWYLTCGKKLTGSQISLPHGINKKLKCETKNKIMSAIGAINDVHS